MRISNAFFIFKSYPQIAVWTDLKFTIMQKVIHNLSTIAVKQRFTPNFSTNICFLCKKLSTITILFVIFICEAVDKSKCKNCQNIYNLTFFDMCKHFIGIFIAKL